LKYGGIAIACGAIAVLSSLLLFLCNTGFVDAPFARTMALTALSLCGSGVAALIEYPRVHIESNCDSRRRPDITKQLLPAATVLPHVAGIQALVVADCELRSYTKIEI
jgi:hypothetical protein